MFIRFLVGEAQIWDVGVSCLPGLRGLESPITIDRMYRLSHYCIIIGSEIQNEKKVIY